jgi:hypothetical protein
MIFSDIKQIEKDSRIKSLAGSGAYAVVIVMLLFLTKCDIAAHLDEQENIEMGGGGAVVALGYPDQGFLNRDSDRGDNGGVKDPSPTPPTPSPTPSPSTPSPAPAVVTSEAESDYVIEKKKQIEEKKRKEREEMDDLIKKNRQEMENQQVEAKRKQQEIDAEIKRKSDEKAKYDNAKSSTGGLFGKNKPGTQTGNGGPGGGNGNTSGQGGRPDGDPNSKNPNGDGGNGPGQGGGNGSGIGPSIGGGLGGRKIESRPPKVIDNSQNTGIVILSVCVDEDGEVTSVNQKLQGSTTTNSELVRKAKDNAKRYKFGKGNSGDCGTITYNFKF